MKKLEELLEWGGMKRDILFLAVSGIALLISIFDLLPLPFDAAWIAIMRDSDRSGGGDRAGDSL